nr:hypothetical protein [uncultured bacterium]AUH21281.1 hypothetical protein [uncultured bacterium]AUH21287.1 hypothetical protein [uncultured bacterium]AUH21292.1 hypothetical protein [uncultured bacterium]AUH21297.1 hypothetical protein [uncultured bacterium]
MRLKYSSDVDILVIELTDKKPVESEYLEDEGIIVDYDENNEIIGLEILDWSKRKDLEIPVIGKFQLAPV